MATTQAATSTRASKFWDVRNWRIGPKLMATFLAVVLLSILLVGTISVSTARDALLKQGVINLTAISGSTGRALDEYLIVHREDISALSGSSEIIAYASNPGNATPMANALKVLKSATNKKDYESIAILNTAGVIILSSYDPDLGNTVNTNPYFSEALRGVSYISDPSISVVTNKPAIFFSAPIINPGGNIMGVVRSRLNLNGIWDLVENDKDAAGPGTFGLLVDENGIRLATSQSLLNREAVTAGLLFSAVSPVPAAALQQFAAAKRFGNSPEVNIPIKPLPEVTAAIKDPAIKVFETTADNSTIRHNASIVGLKTKPWYYVVMAPIPAFTSAADNLTIQLLILGLLVLVATSIAVIFLARTFTAPIVYLTQAADRISMGEMDVKIDIDRQDEIGELAEAFGRMQVGMQAMMERMRSRS